MPIVAYVGDLHAGSYTAICPPSVPLDRGGDYVANRVQVAIWNHWEAYWSRVRQLSKATGETVWGVVGGEFVEGWHHGSSAVITANLQDQRRIAQRIFAPVRGICSQWFVVRGTEAHAGESGRDDESLAQYLRAEVVPGTQDRSTEILRLHCAGTNLRFQHHAWGSMRPWTKGANALRLAAALTYNHYNSDPDQRPHLSIHGHYHTWHDTHDEHPVRVVYVGGWKFDDAYILKLNVSDQPTLVGGLIVTCREGEPPMLEKVKLEIERPRYR